MKKLCLTILIVFMPTSIFSPADSTIITAAAATSQNLKEIGLAGCSDVVGLCASQVDSDPKRK